MYCGTGFLEPMMRAFGATDKILDYALTYTGITSLGFPFLIVTTGEATTIPGRRKSEIFYDVYADRRYY